VSEEIKSRETAPAANAAPPKHENDAIYQEGRPVARVIDPEIRHDAREIRFAEINQSDDLVLPEECEFQKYRLMIQKIEYASRIDKSAPEKGRVLRGVIAEVLGYSET
jgi:hypothetical protein